MSFRKANWSPKPGGLVVGALGSLVVRWDDYSVDQDWDAITGGGFFTTHDPAGRTLFGMDPIVDVSRRGYGVARTLYQAQRRLCRRLNLRRIIAAARLPGYREVRERMSPDLYAMKVIWGDIADPVLRFPLSLGFHYCGILHGYRPEDERVLRARRAHRVAESAACAAASARGDRARARRKCA
jgi:hypothetical protein